MFSSDPVCKQIQSIDKVFKIILFESEMIGKGAFGECYLGYYPFDNSIVLIKKIIRKQGKTYKQFQQDYQREVKNLSQAGKKYNNNSYSNIVYVYPALIISNQRTHAYMVMEFCKNGNLLQLMQIRRKSGTWFSFGEFYNIFTSIFDGYEQLYSCKILHQDLKPQNIFINDGVFKIGDFGLSFQVSQRIRISGTRSYNAPQKYCMGKQKIDYLSDIYSLGIIFYELIFGKHPYFTKQEFEAFMLKHPRNPINHDISINMILKSKLQKVNQQLIQNEIFHEFLMSRTCSDTLSYRVQPKNNKETQILKEIIKMVLLMINFDASQRPKPEQIKQLIAYISKYASKKPIQNLISRRIPTKYKDNIKKYSEAHYVGIDSPIHYFNDKAPQISGLPAIKLFITECETANMVSNLLMNVSSLVQTQIQSKQLYIEWIVSLPKVLKSFNFMITHIKYTQMVSIIANFQEQQRQVYYKFGIDYLLNNTKLNQRFLKDEVESQIEIQCMECQTLYNQLKEYLLKNLAMPGQMLDFSHAICFQCTLILIDLLIIGPSINIQQTQILIKRQKQLSTHKQQQINTIQLSEQIRQKYNIKIDLIQV